MYDATVGRWLEEDPSQFEAGDDNLYRYVKDNPTNGKDPTGLAVEDIDFDVKETGKSLTATQKEIGEGKIAIEKGPKGTISVRFVVPISYQSGGRRNEFKRSIAIGYEGTGCLGDTREGRVGFVQFIASEIHVYKGANFARKAGMAKTTIGTYPLTRDPDKPTWAVDSSDMGKEASPLYDARGVSSRVKDKHVIYDEIGPKLANVKDEMTDNKVTKILFVDFVTTYFVYKDKPYYAIVWASVTTWTPGKGLDGPQYQFPEGKSGPVDAYTPLQKEALDQWITDKRK